ncbi:AAA family ATPase [Candidatus Nomurabacteria bacterium]|nr:AAA family ATPase [Candidatus Nomurabacteria bacterium]
MKYEESSTVELKSELNADFKKEIIALVNTDGGTIYIGVNNNGQVIGVPDPDETMAQIGNMIRDGIKPDLTAYTSIEAIDEDGIKIIRVNLLRGVKRPYHLSDKGLKPNGVFIRHGVSSVPATDEAIRLMLRESDGIAFDKSRCLNQDLTFNYADKYFADAGLSFTPANRRTLNLTDADGYYTNAAMILSDQCEHSIKCAVYEGTGKTMFKARKEFFGSILKQMDESYEYVNLSNNQNSTFEGLKRIDHPDYPPEAIREALINAVIHRDYDYSGSIIINVYEDRIEFVSIGGLVKGITVIDIMNGVSQPRNNVIANIFYRLELIESYGTGIRKIFESYAESPRKPEIRPAPASFIITLPKMTSHMRFYLQEDRMQEILRLLTDKGSMSRKDIESYLAISKQIALKLLNELLKESKIRKDGKAKAVRYSVR